MVGHVVLLLMLVGAVITDDVTYTCKDVTPFTNFSMAQLTGSWAMASLFNFKPNGQPIVVPDDVQQQLDNSEFICQHFLKVNATNDIIEISFLLLGKYHLFEADKREGVFVERIDKGRKLIVLGAEPGRYFSFVICDSNSGNMEVVYLLSRVGGLPENELSLIARGIDESLAFSTSLFILNNQSCWNNPAFSIIWNNLPTSTCSSLTSHNNVSFNDLSGDWVLVSSIIFKDGKPYNARNFQRNYDSTPCAYMQNSKITDERFNMSVITTIKAYGNLTQMTATIELEVDVTGKFARSIGAIGISDRELRVLNIIDSGKFLAIVRCGPQSEDLVEHIDIVSRYGDKTTVISEDTLLHVETSLLDQLNINQSYVTPMRYNHTCFEHHVQLA